MSVASYARKSAAIMELEARKLRRDPTDLLTRAIQPTLWILLFGQVMSRVATLPTGLPYLDFLVPGILAQSVLFVSIFYGISVIWERDLGLLQKFLAAPIPTSAIVLGKGLSAGVRATSQTLVVLLLAILLRVDLTRNPLRLLGVVVVVIVGAALFATLSVILASLVRSRDRFLGVGQLLTMPLFFASNAIYPLAAMPPWLQVVARANPLSYMVDALRQIMLNGPLDYATLGVDALVLGGCAVVAVWLGGRLYPRVVLG